MSTPRSLHLPAHASARTIVTPRLAHAALVAEPAGDPRGVALLVPGFTGSKEDFLAVLDPLADAGFRVITFDQRGQFETAEGHAPDGVTLDVLADDLLALVDHASPDAPVHLVGHSFGGLVARTAALRHPERLASLTLLCSGPGALPEVLWPRMQALAGALSSMTLDEVWEAMQALDREAGVQPPPPDIHAFLRRRFVGNDPHALRSKALILVEEPDRTAELAAVARAAGLPLAVMYGADDDAWPPEWQARMADRMGARTTVIDGAGHSPAVDQPATTAAALAQIWAGEGV